MLFWGSWLILLYLTDYWMHQAKLRLFPDGETELKKIKEAVWKLTDWFLNKCSFKTWKEIVPGCKFSSCPHYLQNNVNCLVLSGKHGRLNTNRAIAVRSQICVIRPGEKIKINSVIVFKLLWVMYNGFFLQACGLDVLTLLLYKNSQQWS